MGHRLDLRMQHGVEDEALRLRPPGRADDRAADGDLLGMDIRADVIDAIHPADRGGDRILAGQVALDDLRGAHSFDHGAMPRPAHEGPDRDALLDEPADHRQARLARRPRDQGPLACGS